MFLLVRASYSLLNQKRKEGEGGREEEKRNILFLHSESHNGKSQVENFEWHWSNSKRGISGNTRYCLKIIQPITIENTIHTTIWTENTAFEYGQELFSEMSHWRSIYVLKICLYICICKCR